MYVRREDRPLYRLPRRELILRKEQCRMQMMKDNEKDGQTDGSIDYVMSRLSHVWRSCFLFQKSSRAKLSALLMVGVGDLRFKIVTATMILQFWFLCINKRSHYQP
jgi:hypothetical protein